MGGVLRAAPGRFAGTYWEILLQAPGEGACAEAPGSTPARGPAPVPANRGPRRPPPSPARPAGQGAGPGGGGPRTGRALPRGGGYEVLPAPDPGQKALGRTDRQPETGPGLPPPGAHSPSAGAAAAQTHPGGGSSAVWVGRPGAWGGGGLHAPGCPPGRLLRGAATPALGAPGSLGGGRRRRRGRSARPGSGWERGRRGPERRRAGGRDGGRDRRTAGGGGRSAEGRGRRRPQQPPAREAPPPGRPSLGPAHHPEARDAAPRLRGAHPLPRVRCGGTGGGRWAQALSPTQPRRVG